MKLLISGLLVLLLGAAVGACASTRAGSGPGPEMPRQAGAVERGPQAPRVHHFGDAGGWVDNGLARDREKISSKSGH